ncbi:Fibrous sheath-interacting protein 2 [Melipona quadrifasciata]|uniref:Fibrous sheath-interacting protein 2 n=1 Tax=Melipona quadrifasciata TaxID=166423 RepID=A0A0M9AAZ5_9HYME|nr:Fibrous sheath-interacting protein 2 [Melipona quadrifasciata]
MKPTCEQYSTDIIGLKRPTALDKLFDSIPKPKGAVPNFGLPKWKVMPLESKIPMVLGPKGVYNFTRRKLGEELWISTPDAEFNLSDPYGYEIKWTYDSLHDKHLLSHFSKPNIIRHLIKSGFITKDLDAKCSLKDYNTYRQYLRRLHCDSIKKELNRITKRSIEERAILYAQKQAEKEVKKLKERERLMELRKSAIKQSKMAEKMKLQRQKEKQKKIEERLQALTQRKKEAQQMQYIKSREKAETIRQKQIAAVNIRRQRIIQTLLEWRKKERTRKKMMEMRLAHEQEEKHKIVKYKWEERLEFQKKQIEKEQLLLQCIEDQRKEFIDAYKEKIDRETKRMRELFEDVKMYIRCYLARHLPGSRERICCKKYFYDDEDETSTMKSVEKSIKQDKDKIKKTLQKEKKKSKEKAVNKGKLKQELKKKKKLAKVEKKKVHETKKVIKDNKTEKKKRRVKKKKVIEPDMELELEPLPESIPSSKTDTVEEPIISEPKEKCRCQAIKDKEKIVYN